MKRVLFTCLLLLCLAGCSTYQMPPFSHVGQWRMEGNSVIHEKATLKLDCSDNIGLPNSNANEGSADLHFIDSQDSFDRYDPAYAHYVKKVLKSIPLKFDAIDVIFRDNFIVLTPAVENEWRPDQYRCSDGAVYVEQAWPLESLVQPHDQVWRNFIFNKKEHRLVTVDRFVKGGRHFAIVQIYQHAHKKAPWSNCMADYTDERNIQLVGTTLEHWFDRWVDAWKCEYQVSNNVTEMP